LYLNQCSPHQHAGVYQISPGFTINHSQPFNHKIKD